MKLGDPGSFGCQVIDLSGGGCWVWAVYRLLDSPPSTSLIMVSERSNPECHFLEGDGPSNPELGSGPCGVVHTRLNGPGVPA